MKTIDELYLSIASEMAGMSVELKRASDKMQYEFSKENNPLDRGTTCITDHYARLAKIERLLSKYDLLCEMNIADVNSKESILPKAEFDEIMK